MSRIYWNYLSTWSTTVSIICYISLETFARNVPRIESPRRRQEEDSLVDSPVQRHERQKDKQRFAERSRNVCLSRWKVRRQTFSCDFCDKFRLAAVGTVTYCKTEENTANGFRRSHVLASCVRENHPWHRCSTWKTVENTCKTIVIDRKIDLGWTWIINGTHVTL